MEININNKIYKIYNIDNEQSIRNKIAIEEGIYDNYIIFEEFLPLDGKISIINLKNELQDKDQSYIENNINKLSEFWKISKKNIILEWLNINSQEILYDDILLKFLIDIDKTDFWSIEIIKKSINFYNKSKEEYLKKLKIKINIEENNIKYIEKYKPVVSTEFIEEFIITEYEINLKLDPLEIFNNIKLNENIPFLRLKYNDEYYYKCIDGIIPLNEWLEDNENPVTFYIKIYNKNEEKENWETISINYNDYIIKDKIYIYKAIMIIEAYPTKGDNENILENIKNLFNDIEVLNSYQKGIKGVFGIPNINISRQVFLDLITNNSVISYYLYTDEKKALSSLKSIFYLYYSTTDNVNDDILTLYLSEKIVTRNDIFFKKNQLPLYTSYLNIRIARANNIQQINIFKLFFSYIIDIYKEEFNNIVNYYNKYIANFSDKNKLILDKSIDENKLKNLQSVLPDLFIPHYAKTCQNPKQPILINKSDIEKYKKDKYNIMNYPKDSDYYYICEKENEFIYPGLIKNKLSNKIIYPHLPCCFIEDQTIDNKLLCNYMKNKSKISSNISNIVKKKAIDNTKFGLLPKNIYYILNDSLINSDMKFKGEFLRQGSSFSKNSFIEIVLSVLDKSFNNLSSDEQKQNYILDFRKNLASKNLSPIIQQIYSINSSNIINDNILNFDIAFDSSIFVHLLEEIYKCQIIIFIRNDNNPNGTIEIPLYNEGYFFNKFNPKLTTLIIYKHYGIESDNLIDPHYELIILKNNTELITNYNNKKFLSNIYNYFSEYYKLFNISTSLYKPFNYNNLFNIKPNSQIIDNYGKTRGFIFSNNIFIITSPINPSPIFDFTKDIPNKKPSCKKVIKFLEKLNIKITKQHIYNNKIIGFVINIPNITFSYIPIKSCKNILSDIPQDKNISFSLYSKYDTIQTNITNKKIANFLMQFLLYSFSLWYLKQNIVKDISINNSETKDFILNNIIKKSNLLEQVEKFLKICFIIKSEYDYRLPSLPRRLSLNNTFFDNDKLIIDSQDTKLKLSNYLRYMINKNKSFVINYSNNQIFLDSFYIYFDDFKFFPNQAIFIGKLSISNWISNQINNNINNIHFYPILSIKEPYFFSHWNINNANPIIFQNVNNGNLFSALTVAYNFYTKKYNTGFDTPINNNIQELIQDKNLDICFYSWNNGILIIEGDSNSPLKIWKFYDNFFGVLLIP